MGILFGDWWGDASVIFIIFVLAIIFYVFYIKEKKSKDEMGVVVSLIIFCISGFEVIGTFIFRDSFTGPEGALLISTGIMIVSLISLIVFGVEVFSEH